MILDVLAITLLFFILIFLAYFSLQWVYKCPKLKVSFQICILCPNTTSHFSKISIAPASELWNPGFIIRFEAVTILLFLFAYPVGSIFNQDWKGKGIIGLNMAYLIMGILEFLYAFLPLETKLLYHWH